MKQLPISSRGWVVIALAGLVLMFGAVKVLGSKDPSPSPVAGNGQTTSDGIPTNTLGDDPVPPMPPSRNEPPISQPPPISEPPPLTIDVPPSTPPNNGSPSTAQQAPSNPTVWVTDEGAWAYEQPGFNMKKVRELKKWEELKIVEATKENWDRVRDLEGNEFWIQKKLVTIILPQNLSQPSVAEKKVMDFYTSVAHGEHSNAYAHLSPEWKRELSFDKFVQGYSRTDSLRSEIVNVYDLGDKRYQVDVSMEAIEEGESVDYLGIYTVERVTGQWFLTSGALKRQSRM